MMKKISFSKKITLYSLFTALCLIFGYIEMLFPLDFIAPGIKLGIANIVPLFLILNKKIKGAFAVNIVRTLLSSLLFGSAFSFIFSFTAGVFAVLVMAIFIKCKKIGTVGISVLGGVTHNIVQLIVALFTVGKGVLYYTPFLIISGIITGIFVGIISHLMFVKLSETIFKLKGVN